MAESKSKPAQKFIALNGAKLFCEVMGAGHPLVFLHDGLVHREVWDEQFAFFARQYKVMRYDRRGYGRSERPWADYSNVKDLRGLLDFLQIEQAVLVGVSAGGMLAIDFALAHPDWVTALVLVGPGLGGFEISAHMRQRGMAAARPLIEDDNLEQTIENWVNDRYLVAPENNVTRQKFRALLTKNSHNLYDPHWHSFDEPGEPAVGRLGEIQVPTLIVIGEADIPDNHAIAGALQVGISNSKRVVLSNAGHLAHFEQPEVFNTLVAEFFTATVF